MSLRDIPSPTQPSGLYGLVFSVAVEINCRPERQDPPDRLLRVALAAGCTFAIDSDAHAPGQLDWLDSGCARVESLGIQPGQVINTRGADDLPGG